MSDSAARCQHTVRGTRVQCQLPSGHEGDHIAPGYECWINGARYATTDVKSHMTGAQIRALPMPSIRDDQDLFLETPGGDDLLVRHDEVVPVAGRRFFSAPTFITAGSPAAKCQECGGERGDHGLGCPRGPYPMAGETMRFDPGSFDNAVRGIETRGRDDV